MEPLLDAEDLRLLLNDAVARWHAEPQEYSEAQNHDHPHPLLRLALANLGFNFDLWHEEDKARDKGAQAGEIATVKRNIDKLNQQRNDAMERIDEFVLAELAGHGVQAAKDAPLHSESVGNIVDRLAILALKVFHMHEQTGREDVDEAHRAECAAKLAILEEQQRDLAGSLALLQENLCLGRTRFKVYRQMKMYNDPALNPVLYGAKEG
jgi:hypothetical protein